MRGMAQNSSGDRPVRKHGDSGGSSHSPLPGIPPRVRPTARDTSYRGKGDAGLSKGREGNWDDSFDEDEDTGVIEVLIVTDPERAFQACKRKLSRETEKLKRGE